MSDYYQGHKLTTYLEKKLNRERCNAWRNYFALKAKLDQLLYEVSSSAEELSIWSGEDEEERSVMVADISSSAAAISSVQTTTIPIHIVNELKELLGVLNKEINCSICLMSINFKTVDEAYLTDCGHYFHKACVKDLKESETASCDKCPMCKAKLFFRGIV